MIDLSHEQIVTLSEASRLIPGRPSATTCWRWRTKGVGGRVLESVTIGGRVYTSVEAIERFSCQAGGTPADSPRTPAARQRDIERAERELEKAGI